MCLGGQPLIFLRIRALTLPSILEHEPMTINLEAETSPLYWPMTTVQGGMFFHSLGFLSLNMYNQSRKMLKGIGSNRKMRRQLMKQMKMGDLEL